MNKLAKLALPWMVLALVGCNESRVYVNNPDDNHQGSDFVPYLKAFHMIDSYGISTEFDPGEPLVLDPYYDAGLFEIDWQVDSLEDYQVKFRVGERSSIRHSTPVYTEVCGEGLPCDQEAIRLCQYYSDLTMACGLDDRLIDISAQVHTLPQRLYAFLEVCDLNSNYCEYDYYRVLVE